MFSSELSVAILKELIDNIHDTNQTEEETDKELHKFKMVSYEENRVDQLTMNDQVKKKDSI